MGEAPTRFPQYVKARAAFFDEAGRFLNGDAQDAILADIDKQLAQKGITAEQRQNAEQIRAEVSDIFEKTPGSLQGADEHPGPPLEEASRAPSASSACPPPPRRTSA